MASHLRSFPSPSFPRQTASSRQSSSSSSSSSSATRTFIQRLSSSSSSSSSSPSSSSCSSFLRSSSHNSRRRLIGSYWRCSSQIFAIFVAAVFVRATSAGQDSRRSLIGHDQTSQVPATVLLSPDPVFPNVLGRIKLYEEDGMSSQLKIAASGAKSQQQVSSSQESSKPSPTSPSAPAACDLEDGSWEVDDSWPLYQSESCPFAREETMCAKYGKPNLDYAKLRWVLTGERGNPDGGSGDSSEKCSVPKVTGSNLCKRVAGHRIAFVGDSLSQNAFESMACLMHRFTGMPEVRLNKHRDRMYHWHQCNFTIAFSFHQFLAEVAWNKVKVSDGGAILLDQSGKRWTKHIQAFNTFVINSGHWWSERQLARYNITLAPPYKSLHYLLAYRRALNQTLSEFLRPELASKQVFFTTSAPSHDIHGLCPERKVVKKTDTKRFKRMRLPWTVEKNTVLVDVVRGFEEKQVRAAKGFQGARIKLLDMYNVTLYRQEAHPSTFNARGNWDCLHYCLPGVPDAWNEILLWQMEAGKPKTKRP